MRPRLSAWRTRSSNGLRTELRPFSSGMISLAFSWSFQNVGLFISCSSASRRDCFSPKSKRVSELEDLVDHAFGRSLQLGVHGMAPDSGKCRAVRSCRGSAMIV